MNIGSVSLNTTTAATHQSRPKPPSMDTTAQALGLSSDDLQSQLKSGKTLNDIASAQGVSSDDLLKALKSDLEANKPADAPTLSDDQLTEMASNIAAGKGPKGPHGHGGPPPARPADETDTDANLETLADNLGLSSDELLEKLQQGLNTSSIWGSSASNPYTANKFSVSGGVAIDTYA
jgi:AraC-like DNA-binding protein